MDYDNAAALCAFHSLNGIGQKGLWKIKAEFGSFKKGWQADLTAVQNSTLSAAARQVFIDGRKTIDPASLLDSLVSQDIKICCIEDDEYPEMLRSIFDPPYLFYYRGNLNVLKQFCLAVVGSRRATSYGKISARRLTRELAELGITIVSGMARGIDSEAHQGALDSGGKTVAVLGSGIDVVYPAENRDLYTKLCQEGLVISEFKPSMQPVPGNFPMRNRTIAGLSRGVLVVEAKQRSGALITADFALEQGRDVLAVPGPISSPNSVGPNNLIKQGAILVGGTEDILLEYNLLPDNRPTVIQDELDFELSAAEAAVVEQLAVEALHFDNLLKKVDVNIGLLNSILLKLELKGIIRALPGNYYVKI